LELGTDYIEPDLVATKDNRLIAVHNVDLNITTNIQNAYPDRQRTIELDGEKVSGYFAFDFTLDELQSIRVKQRIEGRSTSFDYQVSSSASSLAFNFNLCRLSTDFLTFFFS